MTKSRGIRIKRGTRVKWLAENEGKHFCYCGCGEVIPLRVTHYGKVPRFIHGHNGRGIKKPRPPALPCRCGCGGLATPGKTYISGHNSKGRVLSDEGRKKIARAQTGQGNSRYGKRPHNFVGRYVSKYGYTMIPSKGHPFGRGSSSYVMEHRLLVEADLRENDPSSQWLVDVNGVLYLRPEVDVHHLDEDKSHNVLSNLKVMSKADHARLHVVYPKRN